MRTAFLAVVMLAALATVAFGQAQYYFEFQAGPGREVPADCSTWHELYPTFCLPHHQDDYFDNGDGVISACDGIVLDGLRYHVDWVGPTYILDHNGQMSYWEPMGTGGCNPVCETWHQVYPDFCVTAHVDMWEDTDGSGTVTACDYLMLGGVLYHVADVQLDIQTSPCSPVDNTSWGQIKSLFGTF
jgi:hypothetical protein